MHLDTTFVPGLGRHVCAHCLKQIVADDDVSVHTRLVPIVPPLGMPHPTHASHWQYTRACDYAHSKCALEAGDELTTYGREWTYLGRRGMQPPEASGEALVVIVPSSGVA